MSEMIDVAYKVTRESMHIAADSIYNTTRIFIDRRNE